MLTSTVSYQFLDLNLVVQPEQVYRGSLRLALPKLSFDLLLTLVQAAPAVVTLEALMARVWPSQVVTPQTVTQRIKLLRQALGDDSRQPRYIGSIRGRGYRLLPIVTAVPALASNAAASLANIAQPQPAALQAWSLMRSNEVHLLRSSVAILSITLAVTLLRSEVPVADIAQAVASNSRELSVDAATPLAGGGWGEALAVLENALASGLSDPAGLMRYTELLFPAGQDNQGGAVLAQALRTDLLNTSLQGAYIPILARSDKPERAWTLLKQATALQPAEPSFRHLRADLLLWLAADTRLKQTLHTEGGTPRSWFNGYRPEPLPRDEQLLAQFDSLRILQEYDALQRLLDTHPDHLLQSAQRIASGPQPIAHLQGWLHLLRGDSNAAAVEGRKLQAFLEATAGLPQHATYRQVLAAAAALFIGDKATALSISEQIDNTANTALLEMRFWLPAIAAWAGAQEVAVQRLRKLTTEVPVRLLPGEVLLDPLFTIPLAGHSGFAVLQAELEAQALAFAFLVSEQVAA